MSLNSQDITVVEQALNHAIEMEEDERQVRMYREVLLKLHLSSLQAVSGMMEPGTMFDDGFRYDYDDSSDLK
ncbi:hypothetical protein [Paenibacillus sp. MBLB4367]|uniref:hypothetical protein n=1 Tax=Paenibacillus sp. MBLB4367 TaxID=3384767 RepID=UPI003908259F